MAGTLLQTPTNGAGNYTDFITQMEKLKRGFFNIDFTTLTDGATAPEIEAGSWIEISNNIYTFGTQEAATGWGGIANSTVAYMKVVPAGTDITAEFTDSAPTYDDLKNGWYDSDDRYVLWLYKDGSGNYDNMVTEPEVTRNFQMTGTVFGDATFDNDLTVGNDLTVTGGDIIITKTRYFTPALMGVIETGNTNFYGSYTAMSANVKVHVPLFLPHGAVVTELYSYVDALTGGQLDVRIYNSLLTSTGDTEMAITTHTGTGAQTDSSITQATIDNSTKAYRIELDTNASGSAINLTGLRVTYTIARPLP